MKRYLLHAVILALVALSATTVRAAAHHGPDEVAAIIADRAAEHGAPLGVMLAIARCESRLGQDLYNRGSGATGVFQWVRGGLWHSTPAARIWGISIWEAYAEDHDGALWIDCDMAAWSLARGYRGHWAC